MTVRLYLEDSGLRSATARVAAVVPGGVVLDRSPFYPRGGGQPGDMGELVWEGGRLAVGEATKGEGEAVILPLDRQAPAVGSSVEVQVDWPRRFAHMRMHTALHLLCSVLPEAAVTGGQIGAEKSRLDFDLAAPPAAEEIAARLQALVAADHPVTTQWVDDSVLDTNPELVRTLSVKPPRGSGRLRLVRIGSPAQAIDLQPCGGTHVSSAGQIGGLRVLKIENKGRQNRRIYLALES